MCSGDLHVIVVAIIDFHNNFDLVFCHIFIFFKSSNKIIFMPFILAIIAVEK